MRLDFLPNAIMLLFVSVLMIVQIMLTIEFWSTFAGDDHAYGLVFQVLGVSFAVIEIVALLVAARAGRQGAWARATIFRVVFIGLLGLNYVSDIGAIYTFTTRDADMRGARVAEGQTVATEVAEWVARRDALHAALARDNLDLPVGALQAQLDAAETARDASGISAATRGWRTTRAATLEAAVTTASEIETLDRQIASARAGGATIAHANHPQIDAINAVLAWMNITSTPDTIRLVLALAMATVLRFVLAFGFWVALPAKKEVRVDKPAKAETEPKPMAARTSTSPTAKRQQDLIDMFNLVNTMNDGQSRKQ